MSGVQTLVGMFPDIERSVIASLYEANDENMERTIENLLALQKGNKAARENQGGVGGSGRANGGGGREEEDDDDWFGFFTGGSEAPGETSDHWLDTMSADLRSKVNSFNDAVNETINYIGDLVTEVVYGDEDEDYEDDDGHAKDERDTGAVQGGAGASGRLKKRRPKARAGGAKAE